MRSRSNRWTRALALAAALTLAAGAVRAQQQQQQQQPPPPDRPARIAGHPNFSGIWQAVNQANWNLESHSAEDLKDFGPLGAIAAIPAGRSVVREGTIPYRPEALARRNENRAQWPAADPEARCYMLGVPRVTYHDLPFQIFQGDGDLLFVYPFAAANRIIHLTDRSELPVDSWMGKSDGRWEGDVLVVVTKWQNGQSWLDRAGNFASNQLTVTERFTLQGPDHMRYEATLDDPQTFTRPWTIEMPLYRLIDQPEQLLEHKCVPFADKLLYQDLLQDTSTRER
jgi:hypothetical protein